MSNTRRTLMIAVIIFLAALAGVFAGRLLVAPPPPSENGLHTLLHNSLDLDATQHAKLDTLEKQFAMRKQALQLEMRADNAKLAAAIEEEHGYGPKVASAVDQSHIVMGQLQKETLEHIFAMRALLRPDQAARFDTGVVKALTADEK
jgi:nickel and cobalt resistance protein CnrR